MEKTQIVDLVNRLKKAGIKVSLTKPRSLLTIQPCKAMPSASN
ncbi:hypothetical protein MKX67_12480 [Cytobacillus sp. FSL W7-1323]|nr:MULTISPECIES: hypothetical protein [Cytobacillus]MDM5207783.1 hypothetical protein [Cytobacillus kochii]MDQ0184385.1 hypothetical protein [Cytobacillus kochii]MEA1852443.1 hypothetical protein [Cytobacillus sp. OWB-43]MED1604683.1 hypothetical protein [Cytobacillus kochii]